MQNPDDFEKLKSNDANFHKLELNLNEACLGSDLFDVRTAIQDNQTVREVHLIMTKEFIDSYPLNQLQLLMTAIGNLPKLKYLCLGQMTGNVQTFGTLPVQAMTTLLHAGGKKVLWLYMRGMILTHIYKGSDEEKEDKGDLDSTIHDEGANRSARKSVKKKKDSKDKKKKKSHKKESKKESKKEDSKKENTTATPTDDKVAKKQAAAKRALDKLGDALVGLKSLKRISLNGHFDDCMLTCQLDPFFEGLGSLKELEILLFAMTRHESRVKVDPSSIGGFFENSPKIKEFNLIYTELSDDHIDEVASAIAKRESLEELTLSGTGDESPNAESVGALFRAPYLKKLTLKELTLDTASVVAMSIALVKYTNLSHVEVQCALDYTELVALQQMIMLNTGIETLHLHMTALENEAAPLDLATATMINPESKLTTIHLEGEDKNEATKKLRDVDLGEWREVVSGVFNVEQANTMDTYTVSLKKV